MLPSDPGAQDFMAELPIPWPSGCGGTLPPKGLAVALVGGREASAAGKARAKAWAKELTQAGVAVLSGLARGIDGAAHTGALEAGPTWGIMGSGLDHPYPPEHTRLMERMAAASGGVITPFPEALPHKWHFPRQDWLLAAWTRGVVVVEAQTKSGSLVTARLALDWAGSFGPAPAPRKIPWRRAPMGSCGKVQREPAAARQTYWRTWQASPWGRFTLDARGIDPLLNDLERTVTKLVIVESPSKAKTITKYLGKEGL